MDVALESTASEAVVAAPPAAPSALRERARSVTRAVARTVLPPLLGLAVFLAAWSLVAASIETSIGAVPGPRAVWDAAGALVEEHARERTKAVEFEARQAERKEAFLREQPGEPWIERQYAGKPTYLDQIVTSLKTVFAGFVLASLVAVPLGILCGSIPLVQSALGPFIQIFRPVSPLAWLPIVMILVSALYTPEEAWFEKSFVSSAITVALCSLWPALINTSLGVASVDRDHLNVARVLRLGWWTKVTKIIVPSALPLIFTGLRLSLGVGWMVLIAAEMLSQNPGLGKFVWDMFQNGSSQTLSMILVAVFTIGFIGCLLDRAMVALERLVTYGGAGAR
ncbi:MAG: ABC transporter permease [Deltaproteobacteria bacterium]|nr:ABC transporter permease [Deltaproteobacteria bacterium]